jgi:hypothetical protein
MDEIHGALMIIVRHFEKSNPYSHSHGKELHEKDVLLPFTDKITLFRMLQRYVDLRADPSDASPGLVDGALGAVGALMDLSLPLSRRPGYSSFRAVLRRPEFKHIKFHRYVNMERCPKCCLYRYKLLSCRQEERAHWERLSSDHHFLEVAQKRRYAVDRAVAASDFPRSELYMALDGGSGFDFVLPHQSANDIELPSKALKAVHSLPMKVMNGLVHGDTRSHVILSPGCIVAGANHLCESIMILVNTCFKDHGLIPPTMSIQLDNASVNHNILCLAFSGLYVPLMGTLVVASGAFSSAVSCLLSFGAPALVRAPANKTILRKETFLN